ncbi:hypothetical protein [Streptomyces swartbergensis]|uniref:hypothetical protein n=1 Tax=Streptomyces swartbergensis TaxID=487165 RepID=UPI003808E324
MGGTVLTRAAQLAPELVAHAVHLTAFMPDFDRLHAGLGRSGHRLRADARELRRTGGTVCPGRPRCDRRAAARPRLR